MPEGCSFDRLIETSEEGFTLDSVGVDAVNRELKITLPAYSSVILRLSK